MKTLIFVGSPRKNGNTSALVGLLAERLEGEVKAVRAFDGGIGACIDCRWCEKNSGCAIKDGMQEVYAYIRDCDNIVVASSVNFCELTGPLLSIFSRLQSYYNARRFRREKPIAKPKKGLAIIVGGGDGGGDRAAATARLALREMNARNILPPVIYEGTDKKPAIEDEATVDKIRAAAEELNRASSAPQTHS
jgi:multimeric flavodoxin WrbA